MTSSRPELVPIDFAEACEFVKEHHRHHLPPLGAKFSIAAAVGDKVVGVAIVGRPVARRLDNGFCAEVTRLCTDGTPHVASMLYAACWRACRAMGYRKLVSYILDTEPGTSLKAAGWKCVGETPGKSWSVKSRPRVDKHPLQGRFRYEITDLTPAVTRIAK